jgi:hypothetical protein
VDLTDELPSGRYFVAWRILADDGHVESGSFGFTVAASGAPAPPASAAVAPAAPQPVWPVVVAACLAAVAIGGAGLVVRRGLVAVRAAGANAVFSGDNHEASARERTPLRR